MPGLHFLPEDSAPQIADALDTWLGGLEDTVDRSERDGRPRTASGPVPTERT